MYLHGLGDTAVYSAATQADIQRCIAAGGYPVLGYTGYDINRAPIAATAYVRACQMPQVAPQSAPAANIAVNVPTTVSAQISPQVSPVFVQQDQPQNSPVSAGTKQDATTHAVSQQEMEDMISSRLSAPGQASDDELLQSLRDLFNPPAPGVMADPGPTGSNPQAVVSPVPQSTAVAASPSLASMGIVAALAALGAIVFSRNARSSRKR